MEVAILILLFIIGACLGSFLCCQARRLHLKASKKSVKKLPARSICLHCHTKIKWYDNIPIISWLILKGKCRKCGKKIGVAEIIAEIGTSVAFFLLGLGAYLNGATIESFLRSTPLDIIILAVFSIFIISLIFLAIYDGLYGELPVFILTISIICAIIIITLKLLGIFSSFGFSWQFIIDSLTSVIVLGGTYLALYLISKGKWVGDGDWLLGVAIGLMLGNPILALFTLFFSNLFACLIMMPKVKKKNLKIPFGPFLISAFVLVYSFSDFFLHML